MYAKIHLCIWAQNRFLFLVKFYTNDEGQYTKLSFVHTPNTGQSSNQHLAIMTLYNFKLDLHSLIFPAKPLVPTNQGEHRSTCEWVTQYLSYHVYMVICVARCRSPYITIILAARWAERISTHCLDQQILGLVPQVSMISHSLVASLDQHYNGFIIYWWHCNDFTYLGLSWNIIKI